MNDSSRRGFLKTSVTSLAAAGFGTTALAMQDDNPSGVPTRALGNTGERIALLNDIINGIPGLGGNAEFLTGFQAVGIGQFIVVHQVIDSHTMFVGNMAQSVEFLNNIHLVARQCGHAHAYAQHQHDEAVS